MNERRVEIAVLGTEGKMKNTMSIFPSHVISLMECDNHIWKCCTTAGKEFLTNVEGFNCITSIEIRTFCAYYVLKDKFSFLIKAGTKNSTITYAGTSHKKAEASLLNTSDYKFIETWEDGKCVRCDGLT